jgi:hypothetical protein
VAATDTLAIIVESLAAAVEPVEIALTSPEMFNSFMLRLGWQTSGYIGSVRQLGGIATKLSQLTGDGLDSQQAGRAIALLVEFFDTVKNLNSATDLPGTIDAGEFASDFPQQLADYLVANYLLNQRRVLGAILLAGGVITRTHKPAAGKRPPYERLEIAWSSVGNLLNDTLSTLRNAYGWGTSRFAQQSFIDNMVTLGDAFAFDVFPHSISQDLRGVLNQGATSTTPLQDANLRWKIFGDRVIPATIELGVDLFVLPPTASTQPGIAVSPYARGLSNTTFDISDSLAIILKGTVDISKGVLVSIRPGQDVTVTSGLLGGSPGAGGEFSATMRSHGNAGAKVIVLGSAGGSRLEYSSLDLTIGVHVDNHGSGFYAEAAMIDGDIVISPSANADGFVAKLLPSDIMVDAALKIGLDSRVGAYFGGTSGLEVEIPSNKTIGPLEIVSATASVKANGRAVLVTFGATCRASMGPLTLQIDNVGLIVDLSFPGMGGNIGPINAALEFKPPDGAGLSIDAAGVTGGGFLKNDPAKQEYSGMLQLQFIDLALQAFGLITTQVPGGVGYSLLALVDAEFPPVQLGWGFTLDGVGGLLAIHRTASTDALHAALKAGQLSSVLFPTNAITNAPAILAELDALFPTAPGRFLFGPMALIGWGSPRMLKASIAVVIELPEPVKVILLSRIELRVPDETSPAVRVNMDALGILDLGKDELSFDAVLFDSKLVDFTMSGAMALRAEWGSPDHSEFVLAIGGVHPRFTPPPDFPQLQRITIDMPSAHISKLDFYVGVSEFNVSGHLGFDALLHRDPFRFTSDISGKVAITAGGDDIASVDLEGTFSGPKPYHLAGQFTVHIVFFDVGVSFDYSWGGDLLALLAPVVDVADMLRTAMADVRNWDALLPPGVSPLVTARQIDDTSILLAHPLGRPEVRERIVPLGLAITRFGESVPSGETTFTITALRMGTGTIRHDTIQDDFAPAQFFELTDEEKLERPSFERHDAGVRMAAAPVTSGALVPKTAAYETFFVDTPGALPREDSGVPPAPPSLVDLQIVLQFGSAGRATTRRAGRRYQTPGNPIRVAQPAFVLADKTTMAPVGIGPAAGTTFSDMHALLAGNRALQILATHEMTVN